MKLEQPVSVEIFSRRSMRCADYFLERIKLHQEILNQITPDKWGWWEPVSEKWDPSNLGVCIKESKDKLPKKVIWVRRVRPKSEGGFNVAYVPCLPNDLGIHGTEWLRTALAETDTEPLIKYIQESVLRFDGDIAFIHTVAPEEEPAREIESRYVGAFINRYSLMMDTHTLRHWLPELPWATVFGSAYVRLFGMEKLLSAPAHIVKKLSDEAVYLQLSPKLSDLLEDYAAVNAVRERVKNHIGRDAFFDVAKAYPLRGPVNESGSYTAEEILSFKKPPPIGTVFRVPDFQLIEDEYMKNA